MKCPKCQNADTKVVDSRIIDDGQTIRRRRECEFCNHRFTTFERIGITDLMVIKKDGTRETYDRLKLKKALFLAFAKRETKAEDIDTLINSLEIKWQSEGAEISSKKIGDDVLESLKEEYPVAYVRFASVYKSFESFDDFKELIG